MGKKYTTYRKNFERMVKNGVLARGYKYDEYVEEQINLEDYKQCYKPGFRPREECPRYWFISKEGFLINANGRNLTFVKPNLGQDRPQFTIGGKWDKKRNKKRKNKHITAYGLVGLVWGSYIEPDAYTLMQKNGIDCIGRNEKIDKNGRLKGKVQPHHTDPEGYLKEKTIENYIHNNRPEYIEFLTNKDHTLIGSFNGDTKKDIQRIVAAEYKYEKVPHDHVKVFAYKEVDTRTGQETRIAKVLTPEEASRMKYIPLAAYTIEKQDDEKYKSKKVGYISVKAKEESDLKAFRELPQEEQVEVQRYAKALFEDNKGWKEVEFRYKTISIVATRTV